MCLNGSQCFYSIHDVLLLYIKGRFRAEKMPVWRQSTVRLDLLVLAAIGPKVIGTYGGSQARKTTGHVCNGRRGMGPADSKVPKVGPFSDVTHVTHFRTRWADSVQRKCQFGDSLRTASAFWCSPP